MGGTTLPAEFFGAASGAPILATRASTVLLRPSDMAMGASEAPVTLVWYASSTAQHCARWYEEVFPEIRSRYIETGRVRLVLLEFVTPPGPLAEDCFLVARAAGPKRYFRVLEKTFELFSELILSSGINYHDLLWGIGESCGVSTSKLAAFFFNIRARNALRERVYRHTYGDRVHAVPSFIIGEQFFFEGYNPIEVLAPAIEEAERQILQRAAGEENNSKSSGGGAPEHASPCLRPLSQLR